MGGYLRKCNFLWFRDKPTLKVCKNIRKIQNSIFAPDGTTFEDKLNELITMRYISLAHKIDIIAGKALQPRFSKKQIFDLEKQGEQYYMRSLGDNNLSHAHEYYIFIIPIHAPDKIFCATLLPGASSAMQRQQMQGHTSFCGNKPVHYAGIMRFNNGKLLYWNNASGHFCPSATAHYNFLPHTRLLLPEHLFHAHIFSNKKPPFLIPHNFS